VGATRKDGPEILRGWLLAECITSSGDLNVPPFLIDSFETTAPFNLVSYARDTVLLACYLEGITQILPVMIRVRQTVPEH